jgi:membrane associated rhomboid family serine protease
MVFPIGDTQVKGGFKPIFSYGFIFLNLIIFVGQLLTPGNLVCDYATIPQHILQGRDWFTLVSSMFLHGGFMHIIGNLLFLWVFADNIEATIGNTRFILFYIFGGVFASLAHIYFSGGVATTAGCCIPCADNCDAAGQICSGYIPSLGASGAISAVMGAYLVMFPKSQIKIIFLLLFSTFHMSAWAFLGIWFAQQFIAGVGSGDLAVNSTSAEGVAWWAHIGGFVFGVLLGFYFKKFVGIETKTQAPSDAEYV